MDKGGFFVVLCIMGLLAILSSTMSKNPVLPLFADSLGVPEYLMGFVAAASTVPGILVSLPAGSISDVLGRKKVLILSAFVFASAPFLYVFVVSSWQLVLVRFYHGFATAVFVPVTNAAIVESFPESKGARVSDFSSATMVGRGAAPFLGGYILSVTGSSYSSVYVSVGVAGVAALLAGFALREHRVTERKTVGSENEWKGFSHLFRGWTEVATNRGIIGTSLVEAATYFTFGAFEFFLALYAKSLGFDDFSIGIVMGAQLVTVMVTKPFMGRISDRCDRRMPILVGLIIGSLPLIATPFASQFIELVAISIVYGLGLSTVTSSTTALVSDLTSKELYGASIGFLRTVMDMGQALGPIITGFILATTAGYLGAFTAIAGILLVFDIIFYMFTRTKT
ncbi:MAG: MFS transporter [Candidatus Bathyarchaeota archaeon]|nr:MAG: MFS transporter [Candidatus Bathyarchaeota archaeon]